MSFVKWFILRLGLPIRVATDSFQNKYYEQIRKGKISRWVVQKGARNPSDYDSSTISASWRAWLSQTRPNPPT